MSKITSLIRRAPKRFSAVVAMIAAAVIVPAVVFAWGPSRDTFTTAKPASYITFNSITDNPAIGDERNFMQIREASASNSTYADSINLTAGKEYVVFMYYHNNAAANLNLVAKDTYAKAEIPAIVAKDSTGTKANGYIGASNAKPKQVWDDIKFNNKSSGDIALRYIPGSATIHNKGKTDGKTLSDTIISSGATLGFNKIDGKVPGCNEFAGYVTFRIKADQANFSVSKQVRKTGTTALSESVAVKTGDKVDYMIEYKNTGTTEQTDVIVKDVLPKGVTYVPGTSYLKNSSNPNGKLVSDNVVTSKGINIGSYKPGANAFLKFTAKITATKDDLACGKNTLKNVATVYTKNGSKYDGANVTIDKECKPPVVKYTCDNLDVKKLTRTSVRFTTTTSQENATFKSVTYTVRDASGKVVDTKTSTSKTLDYTQTKVGKYTVEAAVTFMVNGQEKTVTDAKCKKPFEIEKEVVYKYTCNALEVTPITRTQFRFAVAYTVENAQFKSVEFVVRNAAGTVVDRIPATSNNATYTQTQAGNYTVQATLTFSVNGQDKTVTDAKCKKPFEVKDLPKEITVCDLETKKPVTIKESEFDSSKHSRDFDDCKEAPKLIKVCDLDSKKIVKINKEEFDATKHSTDLSKCETPVVPPELPTTGTTENIVAVLGLGAMIASIAYYAASRRALNQ